MGSFLPNLQMIYEHWRMAMIQGGVFFIGIFSAGIVLKYRLSLLMRFPLWLIDRIMKFLSANANPYLIFMFIAAFNSIAILIYMSTGAISPILPTAICFLTGMNIGIVAGAMPYIIVSTQKEQARKQITPPEPREETKTAFVLRSIGAVLVASLELPALWFSIAMGATIEKTLFNPAFTPAVLYERVSAYIMIIVPVLIISAAIETAVIHISVASGGPPGCGEDK